MMNLFFEQMITWPNIKKYVCTSFLLFLVYASVGQQTTYITDSLDHQVFSYDRIGILEDKNNHYTIENINRQDFNIQTTKASPSNPNYPNTYWLRIKIQPNPQSDKKWFLEFYDQTIDDITVYIPNQAGNYDHLEAGDNYPFAHRRFEHKNFLFEYPNKTEKEHFVYFKIQSHELNNFIIVLRSQEKLIQYALTEYLFLGLILGMILIISLFNFLTFFAIRKVQYLYYSFYILFVGLYEASQTGIAYQYLWRNQPEWNQMAFGVALYAVIILALLFTKSFLALKESAPKLDKYVSYMIGLRTAWFIFVLFFDRELFEYREIEIIPLTLAFYVGLHTYNKKIIHARYFIGAYGLLFLGFLIKTLVNINMIPFTIITHYSITIAFLGEMLFLSLALGDKIKVIEYQRDQSKARLITTLEEKDRLSTKINRELEQKVAERTEELQKTKDKLEQQAAQITQFNLQLDQKNRELKKTVTANLNKRIMKKLVDFDEFSAIYPDKLSCYRYLNQLKEKQSYSCLKCKNDKYFENIKKFSKRCTKCGYNESITTGTIFKGIKFPIEKAFYIVYLVVTDEQNMTVERLSTMLDMRSNTCWAFKKKVQQLFIDKNIKPKDFNTYENWDFLLTE